MLIVRRLYLSVFLCISVGPFILQASDIKELLSISERQKIDDENHFIYFQSLTDIKTQKNLYTKNIQDSSQLLSVGDRQKIDDNDHALVFICTEKVKYKN